MSTIQFTPVNAPVVEELRSNSIQFLLNIAQNGDWSKYQLDERTIHLLNHPDLVQDFLIRKASYFDKPTIIKSILSEAFPDTLFIADGDHWKRQHKLVMPAFHGGRISAYADTMVDLTQQLIRNWQTGTQINIDYEMVHLTMRVITQTMFHMELDEDMMAIGDLVGDLFMIWGKRISFPDKNPDEFKQQTEDIVAKLNSLIDTTIQHWREKGEDQGDLLSMLMLSTYEDGSKMEDQMLRNELIGIFAAGHETTAHTLGYAFYLLASHPEIKAKLQAEIDTQLNGERATFESIRRLPYLDMVIKETMRLYPVAQTLSRIANQDTEVCGVPIAKGETAAVSIWAMHHDERWYPNSWIFDPERFTPENEKSIPKYAYIPFGAGPRVCIGNQFAKLEACMVLVTILHNFDFELEDGYVMTPQAAFSTKPQDGVPLTMHLREEI